MSFSVAAQIATNALTVVLTTLATASVRRRPPHGHTPLYHRRCCVGEDDASDGAYDGDIPIRCLFGTDLFDCGSRGCQELQSTTENSIGTSCGTPTAPVTLVLESTGITVTRCDIQCTTAVSHYNLPCVSYNYNSRTRSCKVYTGNPAVASESTTTGADADDRCYTRSAEVKLGTQYVGVGHPMAMYPYWKRGSMPLLTQCEYRCGIWIECHAFAYSTELEECQMFTRSIVILPPSEFEGPFYHGTGTISVATLHDSFGVLSGRLNTSTTDAALFRTYSISSHYVSGTPTVNTGTTAPYTAAVLAEQCTGMFLVGRYGSSRELCHAKASAIVPCYPTRSTSSMVISYANPVVRGHLNYETTLNNCYCIASTTGGCPGTTSYSAEYETAYITWDPQLGRRLFQTTPSPPPPPPPSPPGHHDRCGVEVTENDHRLLSDNALGYAPADTHVVDAGLLNALACRSLCSRTSSCMAWVLEDPSNCYLYSEWTRRDYSSSTATYTTGYCTRDPDMVIDEATCLVDYGVDYMGNDVVNAIGDNIQTAAACAQYCRDNHPTATHYTRSAEFNAFGAVPKDRCFCKASDAGRMSFGGRESGQVCFHKPGWLEVWVSRSIASALRSADTHTPTAHRTALLCSVGDKGGNHRHHRRNAARVYCTPFRRN